MRNWYIYSRNCCDVLMIPGGFLTISRQQERWRNQMEGCCLQHSLLPHSYPSFLPILKVGSLCKFLCISSLYMASIACIPNHEEIWILVGMAALDTSGDCYHTLDLS